VTAPVGLDVALPNIDAFACDLCAPDALKGGWLAAGAHAAQHAAY